MVRFAVLLSLTVAVISIPASHVLSGASRPRVPKVEVCHNGFVIQVSARAAAAHVRGHGDCAGEDIIIRTDRQDRRVQFCECVPEDPCEDVDCNDDNECTADSCDSETGECVHETVDGACDDGRFCTVSDKCSDGQCVGESRNCDDGNPCTDDGCSENLGQCTHEPANGISCEDGDACTNDDTCQDGTCVGGEPTVCPRGEQCDATGDCVPISCDSLVDADACVVSGCTWCDGEYPRCAGYDTCQTTSSCIFFHTEEGCTTVGAASVPCTWFPDSNECRYGPEVPCGEMSKFECIDPGFGGRFCEWNPSSSECVDVGLTPCSAYTQRQQCDQASASCIWCGDGCFEPDECTPVQPVTTPCSSFGLGECHAWAEDCEWCGNHCRQKDELCPCNLSQNQYQCEQTSADCSWCDGGDGPDGPCSEASECAAAPPIVGGNCAPITDEASCIASPEGCEWCGSCMPLTGQCSCTAFTSEASCEAASSDYCGWCDASNECTYKDACGGTL